MAVCSACGGATEAAMAVQRYTSGDFAVTFDSDVCTHAGRCVKGLPGVFDAKAKPWINVEGATADEIEAQVKKCPSRALGFERNCSGG